MFVCVRVCVCVCVCVCVRARVPVEPFSAKSTQTPSPYLWVPPASGQLSTALQNGTALWWPE